MTARKPKPLDTIINNLKHDIYASFGVPFDPMHKWPDQRLQFESDDRGLMRFGEQVRQAVNKLDWALYSQELLVEKSRKPSNPRYPMVKPPKAKPKAPSRS